ncbi:PatA/PatG family cyanobactin maturation protease [Phreatobacter sp.]|uniref:PatA/PatG family cyanobactin maturation protease n=1 Tax=Phreatobacter sp. TaxID=1966341 RepID=UPI003F729363
MVNTTYEGIRREELGWGDPRVVVAVLDGEVDLGHACFAGARLTRLSATGAEASGARLHGTHVASIIFGQPGSPVEGVAPGCTGLIVPVFRETASGLACSQLDLARAMLAAVEQGATIINISGGQLSASGEPEPLLARAVETCARRGVLVVAAAGNDGCACLHVPAAIDGVLAVGACDHAGQPIEASNWGARYRAAGLLAPGVAILGAEAGGGVVRRTGTSFATPLVAGIAALLAGAEHAAGRTPDLLRIREALLQSAEPCAPQTAAGRCLAGRIAIKPALALIMGGQSVTDQALHPAGQAEPGIPDLPPVAGRFSGPLAPAAMPLAPGVLAQGCSCGGEGGANGGDHHGKEEGGAGGSSCGCGGKPGGCSCGKSGPPQLVYALGRLGIDFGTEARRDSYAQAMGTGMPEDPQALLSHLADAPYDASGLIWTLNLDATPIYAVQPAGAFAAIGYDRLREFLSAQIGEEGAELVSVPGVVAGSTRLMSGQVVPVLAPAIRGFFCWKSKPLVELALGVLPKGAEAQAAYEKQSAGVLDFLNRVYYDMRNLGITAEERAMNYAATNAFQISEVIAGASRANLDLDGLAVRKSPVCRPDSDCHDVELSFFDPENTNRASRIYRFTVDVSDIIPVTIGTVRSWTRRI